MEVTSVNLARAVLFYPSGAEVSSGRVSLAEASAKLRERYGFMKHPVTLEEWHSNDGAVFLQGSHDGIIITRLVLYARGIAVETHTDTKDSEKVLQDILAWGATNVGLLGPRLAQGRKLYLSELTFVMEASLNWLHPALIVLSERVNAAVGSFAPGGKYETTAVTLNLDISNMRSSPGAFMLDRRAGVPFSENTYFSSAPMPTADHKQALQEFESALLAGHKG
jgi:hypothetical protein